jgi:hypothetical protein
MYLDLLYGHTRYPLKYSTNILVLGHTNYNTSAKAGYSKSLEESISSILTRGASSNTARGTSKAHKQAPPPYQMSIIMPESSKWALVMPLACPDNLSGGGMHVHIDWEATVLLGKDECVVDCHPDFDNELALAF